MQLSLPTTDTLLTRVDTPYTNYSAYQQSHKLPHQNLDSSFTELFGYLV
jgi:hypothetical protein